MKRGITKTVTMLVRADSHITVDDMKERLPSYSRQQIKRAAFNAVACGYITAEKQERNDKGHPLPILYYPLETQQ